MSTGGGAVLTSIEPYAGRLLATAHALDRQVAAVDAVAGSDVPGGFLASRSAVRSIRAATRGIADDVHGATDWLRSDRSPLSRPLVAHADEAVRQLRAAAREFDRRDASSFGRALAGPRQQLVEAVALLRSPVSLPTAPMLDESTAVLGASRIDMARVYGLLDTGAPAADLQHQRGLELAARIPDSGAAREALEHVLATTAHGTELDRLDAVAPFGLLRPELRRDIVDTAAGGGWSGTLHAAADRTPEAAAEQLAALSARHAPAVADARVRELLAADAAGGRTLRGVRELATVLETGDARQLPWIGRLHDPQRLARELRAISGRDVLWSWRGADVAVEAMRLAQSNPSRKVVAAELGAAIRAEDHVRIAALLSLDRSLLPDLGRGMFTRRLPGLAVVDDVLDNRNGDPDDWAVLRAWAGAGELDEVRRGLAAPAQAPVRTLLHAAALPDAVRGAPAARLPRGVEADALTRDSARGALVGAHQVLVDLRAGETSIAELLKRPHDEVRYSAAVGDLAWRLRDVEFPPSLDDFAAALREPHAASAPEVVRRDAGRAQALVITRANPVPAAVPGQAADIATARRHLVAARTALDAGRAKLANVWQGQRTVGPQAGRDTDTALFELARAQRALDRVDPELAAMLATSARDIEVERDLMYIVPTIPGRVYFRSGGPADLNFPRTGNLARAGNTIDVISWQLEAMGAEVGASADAAHLPRQI